MLEILFDLIVSIVEAVILLTVIILPLIYLFEIFYPSKITENVSAISTESVQLS